MHNSEKKTRSAYLWTQVLNTPIWALFNIFQYIIYKDLHATPLQITLIITLKPLVSLLSIYWGSFVENRRDRLLPNVIWARVLSSIPFFFFPFIDNIWFFIASFGCYMMLARGAVPAWMEILKLNTPKPSRAKLFATGALVGHAGNCLCPLAIGWLLDGYFQSWRWLFPATALLSLYSVCLQRNIPMPPAEPQEEAMPETKNVAAQFTAPWKNGWTLMRQRRDFAKFQFGFMLGGAGMMISHPILPQFFIDVLHLSYTEMSFAVNCCKGIGYILATPIWTYYFNKTNIFQFSAFPPLWICLFTIFLLAAQYHIAWLFLAYICYGITQAGGELSWNLSGPIFSGERESSTFSNVNILTVGLRGCIFPPLGSLLHALFTTPFVIATGGLLCLLSNRHLLLESSRIHVANKTQVASPPSN